MIFQVEEPELQYKPPRVLLKHKLTAQERVSYSSMFWTLQSEGERLFRKEIYTKAEKTFRKALELRRRLIGEDGIINVYDRDRINCLLMKAKCRMNSGNAEGALTDVQQAFLEISYSTVPTASEIWALLARAEVYYSLGDFEKALLDFHKGFRERPEIHDFASGVKKTEEAIQKSIGAIDANRIRSKRALGLALEEQKRVEYHTGNRFQKNNTHHIHFEGNQPQTNHKEGKIDRARLHEKVFLEEMFDDKIFLMQLSTCEVMMNAGKKEVGVIINAALSYLNGRVEFWRIRNPTGTTNSSRPSTARPFIKSRPSTSKSSAVSRPATAGSHRSICQVNENQAVYTRKKTSHEWTKKDAIKTTGIMQNWAKIAFPINSFSENDHHDKLSISINNRPTSSNGSRGRDPQSQTQTLATMPSFSERLQMTELIYTSRPPTRPSSRPSTATSVQRLKMDEIVIDDLIDPKLSTIQMSSTHAISHRPSNLVGRSKKSLTTL